MRTIAYIDGYNLYYGCLKNTSYKWLDLFALCQRIANESSNDLELVQVKFFTADVKARLSVHGERSPISQQTYHRALTSKYPQSKLEIIKGYYSLEKASFHPYGKPIRLNETVDVWRPEEKQTDVNIALSMFGDAVSNACDAMLVFSNDTDLVPAVQAVKRHNAAINVGIVFPISEGMRRPQSASLAEQADWTRSTIRNEELAAAQLPELVPTQKKPAIKPDYW